MPRRGPTAQLFDHISGCDIPITARSAYIQLVEPIVSPVVNCLHTGK